MIRTLESTAMGSLGPIPAELGQWFPSKQGTCRDRVVQDRPPGVSSLLTEWEENNTWAVVGAQLRPAAKACTGSVQISLQYLELLGHPARASVTRIRCPYPRMAFCGSRHGEASGQGMR